MPPLRDRPEDIRLYVEHFLEESGATGAFTVDDATLAKLEAQPWPGNVRELRNILERAAALGDEALPDAPGDSDRDPELPSVGGTVDVAIPFKVGKAALVEEYERQYCQRLLSEHDNNITKAARSAEIDRVYLLRLLDKYGLRPRR